jgi:NTE family protein
VVAVASPRFASCLGLRGGQEKGPFPRDNRRQDAESGSRRLAQTMRTMNIGLQQGINMRRRVLQGLQLTGEREVAYWGIAEPVESYGRENPLGFSLMDTQRSAAVPTRLIKYPAEIRELILRAGYAHCDAALRASKIPLPAACKPSFTNLPAVD